ncbi:DUF3558 domain-containing protein [Nocardia callitridis]|uniref:DUF3558 domain-containing protein n=1 Tax=Nocardia callitridis TaxID=648753 RepID=UPI0031EED83C
MARSGLVLVTALLAGGCGSELAPSALPAESESSSTPARSTGPEATSTIESQRSPVSDDELFDPCTIRPEVLRGAALEPDIRRPNKQPGWKICSWTSSDGQPFMSAELYVTKVSYQELLANAHYDRFVPTTVGDRPGTVFRKVGDVDEECYLAWGTATGTAWAAISGFITGDEPRTDPCQYVRGWADAAFPVVPS